MSKIDWDEAPEGATYYHAGNGFFYCKSSYSLLAFRDGHWQESMLMESKRKELIPRSSTAWNGEGLPPVGAECEYLDNQDRWRPAVMSHIGSHLFIVKYQHPTEGEHESCMGISDNLSSDNSRIRNRRTPEQIAADEREQALSKACEIAGCAPGSLIGDAVKKLIDADYRKP